MKIAEYDILIYTFQTGIENQLILVKKHCFEARVISKEFIIHNFITLDLISTATTIIEYSRNRICFQHVHLNQIHDPIPKLCISFNYGTKALQILSTLLAFILCLINYLLQGRSIFHRHGHYVEPLPVKLTVDERYNDGSLLGEAAFSHQHLLHVAGDWGVRPRPQYIPICVFF